MPELTPPNYIGDLIRWKYIKEYLPNGSGHCLDIGCGTMLYKELVESRGYDYTGVDINHTHPDALIGDAEDLQGFKSNYYDIVLIVDVLEHLHHPEKAISEVVRVLKPEGTAIFHIPNSDQTHILLEPKEQPDHIRKGFTHNELRDTLRKYFCHHTFYQTFNIVECIIWEIGHSSICNIPIILREDIDEQIKNYKNLGWLVVAKKTGVKQ